MTCILVGGEPEKRPGFWPKYRENLEHNRRTGYRNSRLEICADLLRQVRVDPAETLYYRDGRLVTERSV
jgi:hypothetical protein